MSSTGGYLPCSFLCVRVKQTTAMVHKILVLQTYRHNIICSTVASSSTMFFIPIEICQQSGEYNPIDCTSYYIFFMNDLWRDGIQPFTYTLLSTTIYQVSYPIAAEQTPPPPIILTNQMFNFVFLP
jgi:hypothetical protein